jgi:penicillin-binding protein 2
VITRLRVLLACIVSLLFIFVVRLLYLQVVMAETLTIQSEQNIRIERRIAPLRGRILARDGTVLADNRIAYDLMYRGGEIFNWERIRFLLSVNDEPSPPNPGDPNERQFGSVIAYNISDDLIPAIEELVAGQNNLYLRKRIERTYPTNLAAQVVGYTAEARGRFEGYALDDLIGIMGIEASYHEELFGVPGLDLVQVDHRVVVLDTNRVQTAQPGQDIVLTIDPNIQRMAEDTLPKALEYVNQRRRMDNLPLEDTVRGAIIVMEPKSGEILAMASVPAFDQNVFTKRPSDPEAVNALLNDRVNLPMMNRAVEAYPPASTFKMVTSYTMLERGYISPGTRYSCSASLNFGGIRFDNWSYPASRGNYNVIDAIADSCNTFYWRAALETPDARRAGWNPLIRQLTEDARLMGFGQPLGIGLLEEKAGRIPTEDWVNQVYEYGWLPGFTLNTTIGQGDVLATPMQVTQMTATIVNHGQQVRPHLVRQIADTPQQLEVSQMPGRFWQVLKDGMRHMVTDYGSSAVIGPRANFPINVSGKTGTAQNPKGRGYDHVWFTAYGPSHDPEIVVTVFIEHGNSSTGVAVPVMRDFMAAYWGVESP